ncbi:hypothetical protein R1flu_029117 [Riccia fluitans]|uniref:Uncharacterized protein n=1 Tax=Riccia fluitans TaxID=41844 RepID=A0ABD1XP56_9MARC
MRIICDRREYDKIRLPETGPHKGESSLDYLQRTWLGCLISAEKTASHAVATVLQGRARAAFHQSKSYIEKPDGKKSPVRDSPNQKQELDIKL